MISDAFDPLLLRAFVSVCQYGSLSRAAEQAGRAQSALSTQIRRLEQLLGKRLLHRTGRGVVPTTDGELFLSYATRILALGETVAARLGERALSGTVRVGLSDDIAVAALPAALGRLRRACPQLQLEIFVDHGEALATRWREGGLDIAVGACSAFDAEPLQSWAVELRWACAVDEEPDPQAPLDLVVFAEPCSWRRTMFDALSRAGRDFRISLSSQNISAVVAAVESGLGVALLPPECINPDTMRILALAAEGDPPIMARFGLFALRRQSEPLLRTIDLLQQSLQTLAQPEAARPVRRESGPVAYNRR